MFIINQSLDIAMKTKGKADYSDFWRLNPYQNDIIVWKSVDDIYIETIYCDLEKIKKHIEQFLKEENN